MKKIININLSGRVIPIEDAAYESLQLYIESLRRYFAGEEGRDEIINDIESRIAELMNDKVKQGAGAVTESDIEEIINAMGRVQDFQEVEADEAAAGATTGASSSTNTTNPQAQSETRKTRGRLHRDSSDKILGGVCSGIANYFNIDPAIVRIIMVLLIFGGGMGFLIYLLLWIFIPSRPLAPVATKRFFRNPDDRIFGGVAGGLAAYFDKDAWIFRAIFAAPLLLNIFFGVLNGIFSPFHNHFFPGIFFGSLTSTFCLSYIVLWIILPEARSPFEKMEMRGENVDVNRIRQNVKTEMESFKANAKAMGDDVKATAKQWTKEAGEFAAPMAKDFATNVANSTKPIARGVGSVIGFIFKAFLLFIAGVMAIGFFIFFIVFVFGGLGDVVNGFLLETPGQQFLGWTAFLLVLGVPLVALITRLVRRLMKVRTHNRYIGWTFAGLWVLGLICAGIFAGTIVRSFHYGGRVNQPVTITQPKGRMIVMVNEPEISYSGSYSFIHTDGNSGNGWDITNDTLKLSDVKVRVEKSDDSLYHVSMIKYGAGNTPEQAKKRAEKINYNVSSTDSFLQLGSGFGISRDDKYRGQKVIVTIQVPVGKIIRFDETINDRLNPINVRVKEHTRFSRRNWDVDWENDSYYDWEAGVDYVMTSTGELKNPTALPTKDKNGVL